MNKHELFLTVVKDSSIAEIFYTEYFAETQTYCQKNESQQTPSSFMNKIMLESTL